MVDKRVVVTGLGVISPNGIGKEAFFEAIFKGVSGIKPISLFNTQDFKAKLAGEVKDFKPEEFLGPKGLRTLDRSTKLIASAAKMAIDDCGIDISEENTHDLGVAIGCSLGSLSSISGFDRERIKDGPRFVNPALFPNTVINSPASQVSIRFNIRGFNTTVSASFSAALEAAGYAARMIRAGRAKAVFCGAVEELCEQTFLGFYAARFLAGLDGSGPEISCPFDQRRNGIVFAEGAAVLVLEDLASALMRKARIYAEVKGTGQGFDAFRIDKYCRSGAGLRTAMRLALEGARVSPEEIGYISCAANSTEDADRIETEAIKDVFGIEAKKIPSSSIKSMAGESFSAGGALQLAAALAALEKQAAPPTINYREKDPHCDLDCVANQAREAKIENVLVNSFGPSGSNSSLIISKFKG